MHTQLLLVLHVLQGNYTSGKGLVQHHRTSHQLQPRVMKIAVALLVVFGVASASSSEAGL